MKRRDFGKGFTLIELLVVIAIIAILAAILFPVFVQAKEKGRQATCLSNQKQVFVGVMLYTDAHNDFIPNNYITPYANMVYFLRPYLKNWKVLSCPSLATIEAPRWDGRSGYNILDGYWYYLRGVPTKLSAIEDTRNTALIMDSDVLPPGFWGAWQNYPWGDLGWLDSPQGFASMLNGKGVYRWATPLFCRHIGGANVCFVDGHARWHKSGAFRASMFTKEKD